MTISFRTVPDFSTLSKDQKDNLAFLSLYIRACDNLYEKGSQPAGDWLIEALTYTLPMKQEAGRVRPFGSCDRDDIYQEFFANAFPKIREYRPLFAKIAFHGETFSLADAVKHSLITAKQKDAIERQFDILHQTVGLTVCPYEDMDEFLTSIRTVIPDPELDPVIGTITPRVYLNAEIKCAVNDVMELSTGIKKNDRARKKRIQEGKEVPKMSSTEATLNRILAAGRPLSYDIMLENADACGMTAEGMFRSVFTGEYANPSAEDIYERAEQEDLLAAIEDYKRTVRDNGLQKRVAQKLFWAKQVEKIIGGSLELSKEEIIKMTIQLKSNC